MGEGIERPKLTLPPIADWVGKMARFEVTPDMKLDVAFPDLVKLCHQLQ
jgi:hypothetical protein